MVLLKGLSDQGFVFYTNFNSKKGNDLKKNPNASMCFHWKSLRRQVRVSGKVVVVDKKKLINILIQENMEVKYQHGHLLNQKNEK